MSKIASQRIPCGLSLKTYKLINGYAYVYAGVDNDWQHSVDEHWDVETYTPDPVLAPKFLGMRKIDDARVVVFRVGTQYIAQLEHMCRVRVQ